MPLPHLAAALSGPILDLERSVLDAMPSIEHWFRNEWQKHAVPFYCAVDLRNSGFKLAPVDMNLFPGGFNKHLWHGDHNGYGWQRSAHAQPEAAQQNGGSEKGPASDRGEVQEGVYTFERANEAVAELSA